MGRAAALQMKIRWARAAGPDRSNPGPAHQALVLLWLVDFCTKHCHPFPAVKNVLPYWGQVTCNSNEIYVYVQCSTESADETIF